MVEISSYLWGALYVLSELHAHGKGKTVFAEYSDWKLEGDDMYTIAMDGAMSVFQDTRNYWQEDDEEDIFIFFDPVIERFWSLCEEYEAKNSIEPMENIFRKDAISALNTAFCFPDYSYDFRSYIGTKCRGGCRIVLRLGIEFNCHYMIAGALCAAYDIFSEGIRRLEKVLQEAV